MQIDLRTVSIKPIRQTYANVARHLGADKPASRYLEGTIGIQCEDNFHYRPLWDQDHQIFDPSRTAIKMKDWYSLKDPRQFYYGTYTIARARMQENAEADFAFVEERDLAAGYPTAARQRALDILVPLRHVAWGANMNNAFMCSYSFGAAVANPCMFHAMDNLGIAQYLTRLCLTLDDAPTLELAKQAWLSGSMWQELRRYVEDSFVVEDWFELFVVQNLVLDGLLYPLIYQHFDTALTAQGSPVVSMLTRFQSEWYAESAKWVDAVVKGAVAENAENKALLSAWTKAWRDRAVQALAPIARHAIDADADTIFTTVVDQFNARAAKAGLML